jgi:hypothetical protein
VADRHLIRCRAKLGDVECFDGRPTRVQFGTDTHMAEDGTFDGETIVCDPCYVALMEWTPSGRVAGDGPARARSPRAGSA